ncbi:hypothetical protein FN846DRAFT_895860 [Sphaerosporella brunnea]|uniref:Uncharacterized protein n=1 Tax=Sphaerosporella brunnea TaxID=1250544 RepID=A0A5J5EEW4_9PEZI|nr:hypothetical protein FN846DRAFT_895860 [Sphaerosporella brunnea]
MSWKNIRVENELFKGWPGEDKIERLCQRADGLFNYASTTCCFIQRQWGHWGPVEALFFVLNDSHRELDGMYTGILSHSITEIGGNRYEQCMNELHDELRMIFGSVRLPFGHYAGQAA